MAYYDDDDNDQLDPNNQQGGVQTSPESGIITGAGGGSNAPQGQASGAPDKSGNFVGLQSYLNANKPQAAKLGDQTAGVINQSGQQAQAGLGALNQEASDKIKATNPLDPAVTQKLSTAAETLSDDERSNIKNTASAQYKGPTDFTGLTSYLDAQKASNKAKQNVDAAGTEEGRMGLITQINSKPRTQGMNVFDNALLQAGGGKEKVQQAAQANAGIPGQLDAATQGIQAQIGRADDPSTPDVNEATGAIGQTNQAQADAYKGIQDAMSAWKTGFTPKVDQARQSLIDQQNALYGDIGDDPLSLTQDNLGRLGLNAGDRLWGLNLNDYITQASPTDINAANVASAEDYARYAALADLAGEQDLMLNPENASQAGTAPGVSVDQQRLASDRSGAEQKYTKNYSTQKGFLNGDVLDNGGRGFNALVSPLMDRLAGGNGVVGSPDAATPKEIESYWLPLFKEAYRESGDNWYQKAIGPMEDQLAQWKSSQKYNSVVKKKG